MPEILRYPTRVTRVEERWRQDYQSGSGDKTVFQSVSTGFWITLDIGLSLPCGAEKPKFQPGDRVRLSLEKSS